MRLRSSIAPTLNMLALLACSTPQVALDQANNGVRLTQNLQTELTRYQRNVKLSAERRLKSIERLEVGAGEITRDNAYATYIATKSGKTDELNARERIRDASNTYAKLIDDDEKARQELAARLAAIVKDLPSPAEKLGAVQKAMADLGSELSAAERVAIVTKFLDEAKAIVDKNAKQADEAAPAPATPASAASVPSAGS